MQKHTVVFLYLLVSAKGREKGMICITKWLSLVLLKLKGKGSKAALVYGQMNEPPGARARVGLSGLTVAEYFRDKEGQDVLFFIDNIFRFTQAGSEVSALTRTNPISSRIPANFVYRYGKFAGKNYHNKQRFNNVSSGNIRTRRRFNRSCAGHFVCSLRCHYCYCQDRSLS